jgi:hypothetical protein
MNQDSSKANKLQVYKLKIQTTKRSDLHSLKKIKFYPNTNRSKLKRLQVYNF